MSSIPNQQDEEAGGSASATPAEYVTILKTELDELRARSTPSRTTAMNVEENPTDMARDETRADGNVSSPTVRSAVQSRGTEATHEGFTETRRLSELERTCKDAVRDRELATSLAGRPLVSGAAVQLIKLWRDDFDAIEEEGEYQVVARDGRSVGQAVSDRLASPEYSHFCLPSSKGGAGGRDTNRAANLSTVAGTPKNLGEAVVMKWREDASKRIDNLLKPVGLRRHR
jgi:hypothetical protein